MLVLLLLAPASSSTGGMGVSFHLPRIPNFREPCQPLSMATPHHPGGSVGWSLLPWVATAWWVWSIRGPPAPWSWFRYGPNQDRSTRILTRTWEHLLEIQGKDSLSSGIQSCKDYASWEFWGPFSPDMATACPRMESRKLGGGVRNWELKTSFQHLDPAVPDSLHTMSQYTPILGWFFLPNNH